MSDNIPFIPLHILEKILLNLDIQTLIRCAFVCRDWNSLITGPDFIFRQVILFRSLEKKERHWVQGWVAMNVGENFSLHLDNNQFDLLRIVEPPTIINGCKSPRMVGISNGLICLADIYYKNIVLWNPTIQKCVLLPRLTMTSGVKKLSLGFGFIRKSNDFKVVKLVSAPDGRVHSAWVFSYLTWSWKQVTRSTPPPPCHINDFSSPVLINGVLHWTPCNIDQKYKFILTFDLASEMFGEISLPRDDIGIPFSIVAAEDSIAVSQRQYVSRVETMSVWVMKQYGVHESWVKMFTTKDLVGQVHHVLDIRKNGDMILIQMESGKIMRYNPSTSTTNVLHGVPARRALLSSAFIGSHVENLFLLDRAEDVNKKKREGSMWK